MLFPCLCVQGLYLFSWLHHLIVRFTAGRTWIKLWATQTAVGKALLTSNGWGSFKQFVSNLEAFAVVTEMRASSGCSSPCLRKTLVCSPAEIWLILAVPNSAACFPAPPEPQLHGYASRRYNPACRAQKPGSGCCSQGSAENQEMMCSLLWLSLHKYPQSFIFPASVIQKKLLAHFSPYIKLWFSDLMKSMNELTAIPCVWCYWCHQEGIVSCWSRRNISPA